MPFLDGIRFLPEAIDSVVTQTYPEWELLLVDDGSTDGSSALARDYARGWPDRIRYLEHAGHANRGKSTSRNLGIAEARGELLAFLDADDIFLPDKLTRQVGLLREQADAVMVYGNTEYWVSWNPDRPVLQRDRLGRLGVATGLRLPAAAIARSLAAQARHRAVHLRVARATSDGGGLRRVRRIHPGHVRGPGVPREDGAGGAGAGGAGLWRAVSSACRLHLCASDRGSAVSPDPPQRVAAGFPAVARRLRGTSPGRWRRAASAGAACSAAPLRA